MRSRKALIFGLSLAMLCQLAQANAETFEIFSLDAPNCETFSVGESGHSDHCAGPAGFGLVLHYRRSRIDLEITRPGEQRGVKVHRLVDYLGDGQRHFAKRHIRWYIAHERPVAFVMNFAVEPRAYEEAIPLSLVFRVSDGTGDKDCPIATIGEGSRLKVEDIMMASEERSCRIAFPK